MANVVVCCDGTWNTPDDKDREVPTPTNVVKIFNAVASSDGHGTEQARYYHPGVGTDGSWCDRLKGGGTGEGLDKNIMSAYRWLAAHYHAGDNIWLFGFSRGAYTVRSLAGMISRCGLLNPAAGNMMEQQVWDAVDQIFSAYRTKTAVLSSSVRVFHNSE